MWNQCVQEVFDYFCVVGLVGQILVVFEVIVDLFEQICFVVYVCVELYVLVLCLEVLWECLVVGYVDVWQYLVDLVGVVFVGIDIVLLENLLIIVLVLMVVIDGFMIQWIVDLFVIL